MPHNNYQLIMVVLTMIGFVLVVVRDFKGISEKLQKNVIG